MASISCAVSGYQIDIHVCHSSNSNESIGQSSDSYYMYTEILSKMLAKTISILKPSHKTKFDLAEITTTISSCAFMHFYFYNIPPNIHHRNITNRLKMKQYHTVIKNIYILFMGSINSPYSEAVAQHFKQRIERKRERERKGRASYAGAAASLLKLTDDFLM